MAHTVQHWNCKQVQAIELWNQPANSAVHIMEQQQPTPFDPPILRQAHHIRKLPAFRGNVIIMAGQEVSRSISGRLCISKADRSSRAVARPFAASGTRMEENRNWKALRADSVIRSSSSAFCSTDIAE
jgi:hypothetical protein